MKKILRTKLQYNCNKREDFDYVEREWKIVYDRSFDMFVSASTKEECEKAMESFEDAIRAEKIQVCFDSNLEPEFDEKKKLWIGAVEVYVGNDYVADEKEAIREVYREWKLLLKATPVAIETPATVETTEAMEVVEAPATIEKNNSEFLIKEIKNLSSGTILSIARESGFLNSNTITWLEIEALEYEWIEFVEKIKDSSENWKQSWKKFAKYKDDVFEAWLNDEELELESWLISEGLKPEKSTESEVQKEHKRMKKIGGAIYIHRSNVDSLDQQQLELVWERLEQLAKADYPCNSYEVIKIKGDTVSFIECEGWDELREPIVGNAYNVKPDGSVKLTKKREKNPQIYHHKWMFVAEDYDGFDIEKEKAWSERWQSVVPKGLSASLGSKNNWEKFLRDYGLEN